MTNKLRVSEQVIQVLYGSGDANTRAVLDNFYPVHYNRKHTEARLSVRNIPEVLEMLRGVDERNIDTVPLNIQELFWREIHARRRVADLLQYGPVEDPVVNRHLTLMRHQQLGREIAAVRNRYCFFFDNLEESFALSLGQLF